MWIGDSLSLCKALHEGGTVTCEALAERVNVDMRYLREWLSHQAASGNFEYDPAAATSSMPPEQALVFAMKEVRPTCRAASMR